MPCPLREEMLGPRKRKNEVHVFNAVANFLASRVSAEVVAVGIQLNNKSKKKKENIITLSTNNSTPEHICHHAMDVWGQLQAISKEQRDFQMKNNRKYDVGEFEFPSHGQEAIRTFKYTVYRFSLSKLRHRFMKPLGDSGTKLQDFKRYAQIMSDEFSADLRSVWKISMER